MPVVNRRQVLLSAAGLIAAPYVTRADAVDTVRFGVLYPNLTTVIHEIAKRTGAYERQKLNIVETRFKSGQTVEGVEQLWRGKLDFYMGGAPEVPRLNSRLIESGASPPLAVVSGANPGHTSLVLSNKLQPKAIDEILNKPLRIAVSSLSSVHLALFRGYLINEKKVAPPSIGWRFLGIQASNMVPALLTGQIDGFLHSEPTTTLAIVNNAGHLFMQAARGDMGPNPPPATLMSARRNYIKDSNETARRFMQCDVCQIARRHGVGGCRVERTRYENRARRAGAHESDHQLDPRSSTEVVGLHRCIHGRARRAQSQAQAVS
jgi:ABC-type nitrate/sulfonate/bicarbonate transport system substrate-binding protein